MKKKLHHSVFIRLSELLKCFSFWWLKRIISWIVECIGVVKLLSIGNIIAHLVIVLSTSFNNYFLLNVEENKRQSERKCKITFWYSWILTSNFISSSSLSTLLSVQLQMGACMTILVEYINSFVISATLMFYMTVFLWETALHRSCPLW